MSAAPEVCPAGSPRQGSLALGYSTDVPCLTASCVVGSGNTGPKPQPAARHYKSISALNLYPCRGALPNPMDDEEIRLSKRRRVELASQYIEGLPTLCTGGFALALRYWAQSWASLSILRAHSPEADLASLRRRTVPRTATEGTAAWNFVMLVLFPRQGPLLWQAVPL